MSRINIQEIVIMNGFGLALLIFLLLMRYQNGRRSQMREKLFDSMIGFAMIECLAETLSFLVDGKQFLGCRAVSYILNTICVLGTVFVGLFWCMYVDLRIYNSSQRIKERVRFLILPLLVCIVMGLVNLSGCGMLFVITENNIYQRGPYVFVLYMAICFYYAYSIWTVGHSRKNRLYIQHFPVLYYVVPCMLGTLIQGLCYGVSIGWASVAMALLFVYIQLQTLNAYTDPLSGLYNRRYLDVIFDHLKRSAKGSVYGVMIDVNEFKKINDRFGHTAGDDAIRNIGRILSNAVLDCGIAMRYAGDEFILLLTTESEEHVKDTLQQIQENVEQFNVQGKHPYKLSLSMGYDHFDLQTGDTEQFLRAIDDQMYAEKKKYYEDMAMKK